VSYGGESVCPLLYAPAACVHNITASENRKSCPLSKERFCSTSQGVQHHTNGGSPGHRRFNVFKSLKVGSGERKNPIAEGTSPTMKALNVIPTINNTSFTL
ncbi:hypothetical protein AVEN_187643-1, partial [Araneus ventricosus]